MSRGPARRPVASRDRRLRTGTRGMTLTRSWWLSPSCHAGRTTGPGRWSGLATPGLASGVVIVHRHVALKPPVGQVVERLGDRGEDRPDRHVVPDLLVVDE